MSWGAFVAKNKTFSKDAALGHEQMTCYFPRSVFVCDINIQQQKNDTP